MKYWNIILNSAWIAATAAIVLTGLGMIFMPELREYHQNKKRVVEIQASIDEHDATYHDYKNRQERFRTEPRYLERIAHEKGLVYPHEKIFKQDEDDSTVLPIVRDRVE